MSLKKYRALEEKFLASLGPYEDRFEGRGVVTACGTKDCYYIGAYVLIRMLRHLGCGLPVEVWKFDWERDEKWDSIFDAMEGVRVRYYDRKIAEVDRKGWSLKPFAILESSFREVMFLDSDVVPAKNPTFMFDWVKYRESGACFWADVCRTHAKAKPTSKIMSKDAFWHLADMPEIDEPEFESGQLLVDKEKCWRELNLTCQYNSHADWYYKLFLGDKETFHLAWRRLRSEFGFVKGVKHEQVPDGKWFYQPDPDGELLFQHRSGNKLEFSDNIMYPEFVNQVEMVEFIEDLRSVAVGN